MEAGDIERGGQWLCYKRKESRIGSSGMFLLHEMRISSSRSIFRDTNKIPGACSCDAAAGCFDWAFLLAISIQYPLKLPSTNIIFHPTEFNSQHRNKRKARGRVIYALPLDSPNSDVCLSHECEVWIPWAWLGSILGNIVDYQYNIISSLLESGYKIWIPRGSSWQMNAPHFCCFWIS